MNLLKICVAAGLIFFSVSLSAGVSWSAGEQTAQPVDPLYEQMVKLKKRLALDDTQTAKVREILEKEQAVAVKDRETFKNNALDLIQAAYLRKKEKEAQVETLLNSRQKEEFKEIVKMTRFDRHLFHLTEGLLLNDEQVFTVEGILIDYYNKVNELIPEEMRSDEGAGGFMNPPGKGMKPPQGFGTISGMIKSLERKKDRAVKKVLTPGQTILFEQIQNDRKAIEYHTS